MIAIINGNIVQEHGILKDHALLIEQERIYDIVPQAKLASMRIDEVYNAYGGYITPGFIDMHSDHIEAMAAPRPSSIMDMELAVYEFEKECCTHATSRARQAAGGYHRKKPHAAASDSSPLSHAL